MLGLSLCKVSKELQNLIGVLRRKTLKNSLLAHLISLFLILFAMLFAIIPLSLAG
jgi:hypothetical protein